MISVNNVSCRYPEADADSLHGINVTFAEKSFTAIMGANGSGKSTLARTLNGLLIPTSGEVLVDGMSTADERQLTAIRRKIGLVFQDPNLQMTSPTVERELAFGLQNIGVAPEEIRRVVEHELHQLNLSNRRRLAPSLLSGGEKLRLIISAILLMQPEYLVLDETTSFLSPASRKLLIAKLLELHRSARTALILITQFLPEAMKARRLIILNKGQIAFDGIPGDAVSRWEQLVSLGIHIPSEYRSGAMQ